MTYVALLRGINVGGNRKIEMAKLKTTFERIGFSNVKTYIASGNVIFSSDLTDEADITKTIESEIEKDFGFPVDVLLRNFEEIKQLYNEIPDRWVNDKIMKCDVMFLWKSADRPEIIKQLPSNPEFEDLKYFPGAVVWRINREHVTKSRLVKIIGTPIYKQLTIRNANTVRKIYSLMLETSLD
jgi:uncharacterized protein (DUF1697 family)